MRTPHFSLRLLGGFEILRNGRRISERCHGKMRALLAYLAVESNRLHSRQALGGLLWPEKDESHARQSLRQALVSLRAVLGDRDGSSSLFRVTRESIGFNLDSGHDVDVVALDSVKLTACSGAADGSRSSCRECPMVAAAQHPGTFLEGLSVPDAPEFESWMQLKREWFGSCASGVLGRLTACHEQGAYYEQSLWYARAQLQVDPWNEEAHRQVIRLLALGGRPNAAIAHYRHACKRLAQELGVEPEPKTRALFEQLLTGALAPSVGSAR